MNITGASEAAAAQMLQVHGGNLIEAVNAYFNEADVDTHAESNPHTHNSSMDIDDQIDVESSESAPLYSAVRNVGEMPIVLGNWIPHPGSSRPWAVVVNVRGGAPYNDPETHWTVTNNDYNGIEDIEEEMIKAAIEASRCDVEGYGNQQLVDQDNSTSPHFDQKPPGFEDVELAHVASLSIKDAEQEKAPHELGVHISNKSLEEKMGRISIANRRQGFDSSNTETSSQLQSKVGLPYAEDEAGDVEEQPLVWRRFKPARSRNAEYTKSGKVSSQYNGDALQTDKWGGISPAEHAEDLMLEATLFGQIPDAPHFLENCSDWSPCPLSPSTLASQRQLKERQDAAYLEALQADRQKERHQEEENCRKLLEEEEYERKLAAKEASLLHEPSSDDPSSVTLFVRMPDGSRRGRRFMMSDKLQLLFDYVDLGRDVKPGTYRLVRAFPRRSFTVDEQMLSLSELGLTNKQELLYLELIYK